MPRRTTADLLAGEVSRRRFAAGLVLGAAGGAAALAPAVAQSAVRLPAAQSLQDELAQALRRGSPLVVMVSVDGCAFCHIARQHHLGPLARQGLPVVQVDWRSAASVRDFAGAPTTHDQLVRRWGITVAPTLLFFGPGGQEVAERMVGGYIADFYGAYLDDRLQTARLALQRR